ncbi:hypothetical protein [Haloarchaeobius sp. TZWSO28]|uniref:hypothetical protein n=1 Tax=Haloarchaeobius sp. TZWSO28 TaxID=3446119 RepID=UPI003EC1397B
MSSPEHAPESTEVSRHKNAGAPDPRKAPAEVFAEIDRDKCQYPNRKGRKCGNDSIPGTLYCPDHIGQALEDAELREDDGIIHATDIDGTVLATTDRTNLRFELEVGDDAILHPVDGGDSVTMTWHELAIRRKFGEIYLPDGCDSANFGDAVSALANGTGSTNYSADARDPIEAETDRGELRADGGTPESE